MVFPPYVVLDDCRALIVASSDTRNVDNGMLSLQYVFECVAAYDQNFPYDKNISDKGRHI
jgi:hypothetical protein